MSGRHGGQSESGQNLVGTSSRLARGISCQAQAKFNLVDNSRANELRLGRLKNIADSHGELTRGPPPGFVSVAKREAITDVVGDRDVTADRREQTSER